jgi:hypothetical protein
MINKCALKGGMGGEHEAGKEEEEDEEEQEEERCVAANGVPVKRRLSVTASAFRLHA